ncbi:MAG: dipeptidase [FCB group bacterium]|jgi:acetylornithine deacetylase/succinyl-diaminopimelate desuccinylase-like protein|nr:dipeptidase [FCB group bacterium]
MSHVQSAIEYARAQRAQQLEQFKEFVAIPSISTLPEHKGDVARAAQWLAEELTRVGMPVVEVVATPGHPVIFAEGPRVEGAPTVLVYGHYDVQPVDPLNEWVSGPFEPMLRDDYLFGRGASDMKGQIHAQIKAVEALMRNGGVPVNLKYMVEGEEEIGSPNLEAFVEANRERLRCDAVLNCDAAVHAPDVPAITYSLRGLAYFEVEVHGPEKDLHSGLFGGTIHNPVQALCELIAGMHDAQGRVTLPGFYDTVRPLSEEERELLKRVPQSDAEWLEMTGSPATWGEDGYTTVERVGARPTLEVNGLIGGFTGEGSKTVLPAKAMAKISMRLVPDQDPSAIYEQLCAYLREKAPKTITWEVRELNHGAGAVMDRKSIYMRAAEKALREVFGSEPIFKREGGSVPVVSMLQQKLGVDSIMLGFALPSDGIHGPNERQHMPTYYRGIEAYVRFMCGVGDGEF